MCVRPCSFQIGQGKERDGRDGKEKRNLKTEVGEKRLSERTSNKLRHKAREIE